MIKSDEWGDPEEMAQCIAKMRAASNNFYSGAVKAGNHAFIEFCGLMNEYIKVCEAAASSGNDFRNMSTHTGNRLPFESHHLKYIREKLECIYGVNVLSE